MIFAVRRQQDKRVAAVPKVQEERSDRFAFQCQCTKSEKCDEHTL
jgi:hypothetical protein